MKVILNCKNRIYYEKKKRDYRKGKKLWESRNYLAIEILLLKIG